VMDQVGGAKRERRKGLSSGGSEGGAGRNESQKEKAEVSKLCGGNFGGCLVFQRGRTQNIGGSSKGI